MPKNILWPEVRACVITDMTKIDKYAVVWNIFDNVLRSNAEITADTLYTSSDKAVHGIIADCAAACFRKARKQGLITRIPDRSTISIRASYSSQLLPYWKSNLYKIDTGK